MRGLGQEGFRGMEVHEGGQRDRWPVEHISYLS